MVAVTKTKDAIEFNTSTNRAHIYVNRLPMAQKIFTDWVNKDHIHWSKYQIKETDMRVKTATFTSEMYLDLTTGVYAVLITSPYHEDFSGIILSVEEDNDKGLYNYQCQDWTRQYQNKIDMIAINITTHRILKHLLTHGELPLTGDITNKQKNYKTALSGLKPAYQYNQKDYGMTRDGKAYNYNPMEQKNKVIIRNKSTIEAIRDLVFGSGAYIDVYANKYGVIQIEPYHKKDFLNNGVTLSANEILDRTIKFDTTNIVTGVEVQSTDTLKAGKAYSSENLTGLDLAALFGNNGVTITNPAQNKNTSASTASKKSTTTKKSNNPYNTKAKNIYLNSDNIKGKSADKKFMNDIAKLLKKQGWKTKVVGVGPNFHTEKYAKKYKNGVWFCIYGGADGAVFKECAGKNSYTNTLKKNNLRTVIGMRQGCSILKGGKCYKYLKRAHDDNYSPSSYKGISYPLNVLTKAKVPIMYAGTAEKMVAKFLKGGDNPKAC